MESEKEHSVGSHQGDQEADLGHVIRVHRPGGRGEGEERDRRSTHRVWERRNNRAERTRIPMTMENTTSLMRKRSELFK